MTLADLQVIKAVRTRTGHDFRNSILAIDRRSLYCRVMATRVSRYALFAAAAITLACFSFTIVAENTDLHRVATWSTANAEVPNLQTFKNQTIREILHTSIGKRAVRIRLANTFGTQPVTFDAVYLGFCRKTEPV